MDQIVEVEFPRPSGVAESLVGWTAGAPSSSEAKPSLAGGYHDWHKIMRELHEINSERIPGDRRDLRTHLILPPFPRGAGFPVSERGKPGNEGAVIRMR